MYVTRRYYEYIYGEYRSNPELQSLYQKYPRTSSMFRSVDRVKLIMSILKCDPNENGAGLVLEKLLKAEIILAAFPLHDRSELQACQSKWLVYWSWPYVSRRPRIAPDFEKKTTGRRRSWRRSQGDASRHTQTAASRETAAGGTSRS